MCVCLPVCVSVATSVLVGAIKPDAGAKMGQIMEFISPRVCVCLSVSVCLVCGSQSVCVHVSICQDCISRTLGINKPDSVRKMGQILELISQQVWGCVCVWLYVWVCLSLYASLLIPLYFQDPGNHQAWRRGENGSDPGAHLTARLLCGPDEDVSSVPGWGKTILPGTPAQKLLQVSHYSNLIGH